MLKKAKKQPFQQETVESSLSGSCGPVGIYCRAGRVVCTVRGHPTCLVSVGPNPWVAYPMALPLTSCSMPDVDNM